MRLRRLSVLLAVLVVAACAAGPDAATPMGPADGPEPEPAPTATPGSEQARTPDAAPTPTPEPAAAVVATVAPLADLVAQVGGQRVAVDLLVPAGADAHTYEPRPGDVALLAEADAYVGIGLDLNPAAVRLAEEHLPDGAPLVLLGEEHLDPQRLIHDHVHDDGHSHTHDDGHTHTHTHDDGHTHTHTHDDDVEAGPNPHVWTSVRLAMELVDGIAAALAQLDPGGAETYDANARAYLLELRALDEAVRAAMATIPPDNRTLITYHDAWGYFAADYDLDAVTAVQPSDFSEPSAADVRELIDLIRAEDVPAVFGSEVFPSDVLDTIAAETGARYVGNLSDDMLPGRPGDPQHSYLGLMRRNATLIVDGLDGDAAAIAALEGS